MKSYLFILKKVLPEPEEESELDSSEDEFDDDEESPLSESSLGLLGESTRSLSSSSGLLWGLGAAIFTKNRFIFLRHVSLGPRQR